MRKVWLLLIAVIVTVAATAASSDMASMEGPATAVTGKRKAASTTTAAPTAHTPSSTTSYVWAMFARVSAFCGFAHPDGETCPSDAHPVGYVGAKRYKSRGNATTGAAHDALVSAGARGGVGGEESEGIKGERRERGVMRTNRLTTGTWMAAAVEVGVLASGCK
jgi:hypothetical protein